MCNFSEGIIALFLSSVARALFTVLSSSHNGVDVAFGGGQVIQNSIRSSRAHPLAAVDQKTRRTFKLAG